MLVACSSESTKDGSRTDQAALEESANRCCHFGGGVASCSPGDGGARGRLKCVNGQLSSCPCDAEPPPAPSETANAGSSDTAAAACADSCEAYNYSLGDCFDGFECLADGCLHDNGCSDTNGANH